jgi:S-adenosylmethionine/arginine decarboxylase-like enzyme
MIGVHLIVDSVLHHSVDKEAGRRILSELPGLIGMKILAGPYIVEGVPENPGWTGFVIIDKSHISIHTFYEGNRISIDIFSCKTFDEEVVIRYLKEHLPFKKMNTRMLERSEE